MGRRHETREGRGQGEAHALIGVDVRLGAGRCARSGGGSGHALAEAQRTPAALAAIVPTTERGRLLHLGRLRPRERAELAPIQRLWDARRTASVRKVATSSWPHAYGERDALEDPDLKRCVWWCTQAGNMWWQDCGVPSAFVAMQPGTRDSFSNRGFGMTMGTDGRTLSALAMVCSASMLTESSRKSRRNLGW
jgi:hypothetical protein